MNFRDDSQKERALLEDALVDIVYDSFDNFVMHGGTAVWRCYGGNRFSRDVDFYANLDEQNESAFQKKIHKILIDKGYPIREEKYNRNTRTLHIIVKGNGTTGKLDITFAHAKGDAVDYARIDGSKRIIYVLGPEELLNEKIETYISKFKSGNSEIHDIYDIMVLKDRVRIPRKKTLDSLAKMLDIVENSPPKNEKQLAGLILSGVSIPFNGIIKSLRGWLDDNAK